LPFWEDEVGISPEDAQVYYDFFADAFLTSIPVPGKDKVLALKAAALVLFPPQSRQPENENYLPGADLMHAFLVEAEKNPEDYQQKLAVDRTYLCRGVQKGALLAPYGGYWQDAQGTTQLAKVRAFYSQHGFSVSKETGERDDYLGLEFAFLALLANREATFRQAGDAQAAEKERSLRKEFIQAHVGSWFSEYCSKALEYAKTDYYKGLLLAIQNLLFQV